MTTALKQLVASAIEDAGRSKVAALQQQVPQPSQAVMSELFGQAAPSEPEPVEQPEPTKVAGIKLAAEGIKLAEALEAAAAVVSVKVAEESNVTDTPDSPETMAAPDPGFTPAKPVVNGQAAKGVEAEPTMKHEGAVELTTNVDNILEDGVEDGGAKTSSLHMLQAQLHGAQRLAQTYEAIGSEALMNEANQKVAHYQAEIEKLAQDPSSPQPDIPSSAVGTDFKLGTNANGGSTGVGEVPDSNAGMIDMTAASARDRSTAEASKYLTETPKKDNAVKAVLGNDEGLKTSSDNNVKIPAVRL